MKIQLCFGRSTLAAVLLLPLLLHAPGLLAADAAIEELRQRLKEVDPTFQPDEIRSIGIEGLYEVVSGTNVFYVTHDGRFMLRGQVVDLEQGRDLTAERRDALIHQAVDSVGEDRMLVYPPSQGQAQHTITVFTDTTCPYCQRLHLGLLKLVEDHPVKVRYLLFPRAGPRGRSAETMRDVWCAADPQQALTDAKAGRPVAPRSEECETPVTEHFRLGQEIGIRGTPYLMVDDQIVPGYRPNEELLRMMGLASDG